MNLTIGSVARYTFKGAFAALGYRAEVENSGIYELTELLSYAEFVSQELDFYDVLYKYVNKTRAELNKAVGSYMAANILKLKPVGSTGPTIYMPLSLLAADPVTGMKPRVRLALTIDLGAFDEKTLLTNLEASLKEIIETRHGIKYNDGSPDSATSQLMTYGSPLWMTDEEYNLAADARLTTVFKNQNRVVVNYFSEKQRLEALLAAADFNQAALNTALGEAKDIITLREARIAELEAQVIQLGGTP